MIAASYERIHRANLVGMGILPLQFADGQDAASVGLRGDETLKTVGLDQAVRPAGRVALEATRPDGSSLSFPATVRLDTPADVEFYRNGGILHTVLRRILQHPG